MLDIIQDYCKKQGVTIAEVEKACKFGNGTISKWDSSDPSFKRVVKVANQLNIPLDTLIKL